jgi:two-component system LytT family response regulator
MKVILVDDEAPARQRLRKLLEGEQDIAILAECANADEALDAIAAHAPDLMFLDIQMPGRTGLELLRDLPAEGRPAVIFVTAFDAHAVKAFELHALDYLLKPFRKERLLESLERAREATKQKQSSGASTQLEQLLRSLPATPAAAYPQRLAVKDGPRITIVPIENIVCLLAGGNYIEICSRDGKKLLLRETMSRLETRLDPAHFFRASRSAVVNLTHLKEILSEGQSGHVLMMANGERIRLTASFSELQGKLR